MKLGLDGQRPGKTDSRDELHSSAPSLVGGAQPNPTLQSPNTMPKLEVGGLSRQQALQLVRAFADAIGARSENQLFAHINGLSAAASRASFGITGEPNDTSLDPGARELIRQLRGPLADLFYAESLSELLDKVPSQRAYAHQVSTFKAEFADAKANGSVAALAERWAELELPSRFRNQLISALTAGATKKDSAPWLAAIKFWQRSAEKFPAYAEEAIGRELFVVCHNKAAEAAFARGDQAAGFPLLAEGVRQAKAYLTQLAGGDASSTFELLNRHHDDHATLNGEVLAGIGKAFLLISREAKKGALSPELRRLLDAEIRARGPAPTNREEARDALELSYRYYQAAYDTDFHYYPGINAVYRLRERGENEEADKLAKLVALSCKQAGGRESSDYWALTTQVELALINRDNHELAALLPLMLGQADEAWKIDSTLINLRSVVLAPRVGSEDTRVLELVCDALQHRVDWLSLPGGLRSAAKSLQADPPDVKAALEQLKGLEQVLKSLAGGQALPPGGAVSNAVSGALQQLTGGAGPAEFAGIVRSLEEASTLQARHNDAKDPKREWISRLSIAAAELGAVPEGSLKVADLKLAQQFREDLNAISPPEKRGDPSVFDQLKALYPKWKDKLPEAKAVLLTRAWLTISDNMQKLTTGSAIPGNVQFGGLIPDTTITRKSMQLLNAILEARGLAHDSDRQRVYDGVHTLVEDLYGLVDPKTGRRKYEDMEGHDHHILEARERNKYEFAQIHASGENQSDIAVGWALRSGDCRPTNQTLGMACALNRQNVFRDLMKRASHSEEALGEARAWLSKQVRLANFVYSAPIEMEQKYKWKKGAGGLPIRSDRVQDVEDHHKGFELTMAHNDLLDLQAPIVVLDAFYNELYPNKYATYKAEQIFDEHGVFGGEMGITDDRGKKIPFWARPTGYSGQAFKEDGGGADEVLCCGFVVESLTAAGVLGQPERLLGLASDLADLTVGGGTKAVVDALIKNRELFEQGTLMIRRGWEQRLQGLALDPTSSFLGGAQRRMTAGELQGLPRAKIEEQLGAPLSETKWAALKSASSQEIVTDPLLAGAPQLDALPLLTLMLYLSDLRRGEDIDRVILRLLDGTDAAGLSQLTSLILVGEEAALTALGVSAEGRVVPPENLAADTKKVLEDFRARRHDDSKIVRQDVGISKGAAQWLLEQLGPGSPKELLHSIAAGSGLAEFAHVTHNSWKAGKDADLADPTNPFLGAAPRRVQFTAEVQARALEGRSALAKFLGIEAAAISDAKLNTLATSTPRMDQAVVHDQFAPFEEVVARQPGGGAAFVGRNVVPLVVLAEYLLLRHPQATESRAQLESLLGGLLKGTNAALLDELADFQNAGYKAAMLASSVEGGGQRHRSARADNLGSKYLYERARSAALSALSWLAEVRRREVSAGH